MVANILNLIDIQRVKGNPFHSPLCVYVFLKMKYSPNASVCISTFLTRPLNYQGTDWKFYQHRGCPLCVASKCLKGFTELSPSARRFSSFQKSACHCDWIIWLLELVSLLVCQASKEIVLETQVISKEVTLGINKQTPALP